MGTWWALTLGVLGGLAVGALLGLHVLAPRRGSAAGAAPALDPAPATPGALPPGLAAVLDVLPVSAIVVDRDERVLRATPWAVSYGLTRGAHLLHGGLLALVRSVQADGTIREAAFALDRGRPGRLRTHVGVRVAPVADSLVLVLVEDRTQAQRLEEVRRDFVVNVSHELKTPVGGLTLLAEAVAQAADDPAAVTRFAARMQVEAERLGRLVSEIIDLSRLQTADSATDLVIVDVAACAREAVEHTQLLAGRREITQATAAPPDRLRVYGDAELITTAIRNLVANAIAYSADDTRVAVVSRRRDDVVEVSVSDQGTGISVAEQERIFERFYRVDTARSRSTGGTGLGLSIVKHICANHGGDVTVWSQEGQGSTFTIRLPAVLEDPRPAGSAAPAGAHRRTVTAPVGRGRIASSGEALTAPAPDHRTER